MSTIFELYWPKETGSDSGTRMSAHQLEAAGLDAAVRQRVLALAKDTDGVLQLYLPFLDHRESRRRGEVLRALHFIREGAAIRGVPSSQSAALRDLAAHTLLTHAAWSTAPSERDARYFRTWQSVSLALQRALRRWIPEICFRDPAAFEDRAACFPVLLYGASRACHGHPRTEFTYDLADPQAMDQACRMRGQSLQAALAAIEARLHELGRPALARRYAPIWHEDIVRAVKQRPRPLIDILAKEAMLVNAVIELGTARPDAGFNMSNSSLGNMSGVKPFAHAANSALRRVAGVDMRPLLKQVIETATRALERGKRPDAPAEEPAHFLNRQKTYGGLHSPKDGSSLSGLLLRP